MCPMTMNIKVKFENVVYIKSWVEQSSIQNLALSWLEIIFLAGLLACPGVGILL